MKLKTIIKLGTILSVLLFCLAVGYYAFMQVNVANRNRNVNLFALVPDNCAGVLISENINAFLEECPTLNYSSEFDQFQFTGLFNFILGGMNDYLHQNVHGLTYPMNRMMISFHSPYSPRDQVAYFQMSMADEDALVDLLGEFAPGNFLPKEEEYRGKTIRIYPLGNVDFLALYSGPGFVAISYQKRLIEKVIDAQLDETSLEQDESFQRITAGRKSHDSFTLYTHSAPMPFLHADNTCWSEYDFHINSDVLYLTGDIFVSDSMKCISAAEERIHDLPTIKDDRLFLSADKDSTAFYVEQAAVFTEGEEERTLFDECMANLSQDTSFSMVVDMQKVIDDPKRFQHYLPPFVWKNALLLRSFVLSVQVTKNKEQFSHMWVFTYKH